MVAQDVVIACSTDNNCAAWREGSDEQLWNTSIENVSAFIGLDNNSQTVYRREGVRYVILAFHSAVNLDTGELVSFDLPEELLSRGRRGRLGRALHGQRLGGLRLRPGGR